MTQRGRPRRADPPGVGARLRAEREQRDLSLRKLAQRLQISPAALSQVETGTSRPTVRTLYAIVSELGLSLDELLAPAFANGGAARERDRPAPRVQRAEARATIELESGARWQRLTPTSEPGVEFLAVTYEVGGASSTGAWLSRANGYEYGVVLEGVLTAAIGSDRYRLGPGDSISFDATRPHRIANEGTAPVRAIWLSMERAGHMARARARAGAIDVVRPVDRAR